MSWIGFKNRFKKREENKNLTHFVRQNLECFSFGKAISKNNIERQEERKKRGQEAIDGLDNIDAKKTSDEIEQERRRNLLIITSMEDGLVFFDENKKVVFLNPSAEILLEVKKEKLVGKHFFELNSFVYFRPIVPLLTGEIDSIQKKEINIRSVIIEVSLIPALDKSGTLVILRNITKEKMIEQAKSDFVTLAAHQLRTPASAVKWSLRALLDGDVGEISESQREILEKIYKTNDRSIDLIRGLLIVDKIEEGKFVSKKVLASIEKIIMEIIESCEEEIKRKEIKFIFRKDQEIPEIMLDEEKIKLAITNFIDNAVRYTASRGQIIVSLEAGEEQVVVCIKDTGPGIPDDQQGKMFTKFFRGRNIMKIDTEGSGLGLFVSKKIIEEHGGRVWFESKEGSGSSFYFSIPIKEEFSEYLTGEFY